MYIDANLENFSLLILTLNVLFSIRIFRQKADLKWFEINLIWALLIQILAYVWAKVEGNNLPVLHLYTLFEFIFISLFYQQILFRFYSKKNWFYYFLGIVSSIVIYNSLFIEPVTGFNSNAKGLTQVIIISYSIIYFFDRISVNEIKRNLILNRVNAAILLYYAGSLFIFVFAKFLLKNSEIMNDYFWDFNALLYLVFQILILLATWRLVFPKHTEIKSQN